MVGFLLHADVSVDMSDEEGFTPLHHAAGKGYIAIVKRLISGGANVLGRSQLGMQPINMAANSGYFGVLEILLPHMTDQKRQT